MYPSENFEAVSDFADQALDQDSFSPTEDTPNAIDTSSDNEEVAAVDEQRVRVATHSGRIAFEPDRGDERFRATGRLSQIVGPIEAEKIVQRIIDNRRALHRLYVIRMNRQNPRTTR